MIKDYTFNEESNYLDGKLLEELVAELLREKNLTLSVAESLTGGMIAERLVGVAGISANFREGIVAYANEAKISRLKVKLETLENYGAVSDQTAIEMAKGLLLEGVDVGISTTGIAGPSGGTINKPVGTVWFGFAYKDTFYAKKQIFTGNREEIRKKSTNYALMGLYELLLRD